MTIEESYQKFIETNNKIDEMLALGYKYGKKALDKAFLLDMSGIPKDSPLRFFVIDEEDAGKFKKFGFDTYMGLKVVLPGEQI